MVTEKLFVNADLGAGSTSPGVPVELGRLGAQGYFGLDVDCDDVVTLVYKASSDSNTPGDVDDNVLATHVGGGKTCYAPAVGPYAKIWIYAVAPADAPVTGLTATLNIW